MRLSWMTTFVRGSLFFAGTISTRDEWPGRADNRIRRVVQAAVAMPIARSDSTRQSAQCACRVAARMLRRGCGLLVQREDGRSFPCGICDFLVVCCR